MDARTKGHADEGRDEGARVYRYRVVVTRTTTYLVDAPDEETALDTFTVEEDQTTERMQAGPICPDCDSFLTRATIRFLPDGTEEATYCDRCDREIGDVTEEPWPALTTKETP